MDYWLEIKLQSEFSIDDLFQRYWIFLSQASQQPEYYYKNLSTEEFIKFVSMRDLRSRGVDIEKRIALKNSWKKLKRSEESGDLIDANGKRVEVKSSIVTPNRNSTVTLRGFRPWEDKLDYYLIVILDICDFKNNVRSHVFNLPTAHITAENGFKPYSQSKKSRADNINVPLGINFEIDDKVFLKWAQQFKISTIEF